jgi:hypothetical protein
MMMRSVVVSMLPPAHAAANASRLPNQLKLRIEVPVFPQPAINGTTSSALHFAFDVSVPTLPHQP